MFIYTIQKMKVFQLIKQGDFTKTMVAIAAVEKRILL